MGGSPMMMMTMTMTMTTTTMTMTMTMMTMTMTMTMMTNHVLRTGLHPPRDRRRPPPRYEAQPQCTHPVHRIV